MRLYFIFPLLFILSASFLHGQCVNDTQAPHASCQNIAVQLSSTGLVTIQANQLDQGSTDNCGITTYLINGQSSTTLNCSNVGINTVTFLVLDQAGNADSCSATINVTDVTAPFVSCNSAISINLSSVGVATVTPMDINHNSSDNCSISTLLINGTSSITYNCSDVGTNVATLTVTDQSGNTSTCSSIINIIDTIPPIASCSISNVYLPTTGITTITPSMIDNSSLDNCSISTLLVNGAPYITYDYNNLGANNAVLTVTDPSGNTSSCVANITILDTISSPINTSIYKVSAETINVSPNPTNQFITIKSTTAIEQLTVQTLTGQVVIDQRIDQQENIHQLNLEHLPSTVYILTVQTNKGLHSKKILLEK